MWEILWIDGRIGLKVLHFDFYHRSLTDLFLSVITHSFIFFHEYLGNYVDIWGWSLNKKDTNFCPYREYSLERKVDNKQYTEGIYKAFVLKVVSAIITTTG